VIICATTSPDMLFPSTACLIQNELGCVRAAAFDLGAACAGFAYALAVGSQFIAAGSYDRVLVIGADVLTKYVDFTDRGTCILFGDGAGAVVLAPVEDGKGMLAFDLGSDGSGAELLKIPAGGGRAPASEQTVKDRLHYIKMEGKEVFRFAVKVMGESTERTLAKCGLCTEEIDLFVPHQANIRIIDSAARRLGIPLERVYVNVDRYGNTSSGSIPIALYEAWQHGRLNPDDKVVIVGFGAGLTWASSVTVWTMPSVGLSDQSAEDENACGVRAAE
ncbi:MAG: beta-ketoacyl-ACP synthase III, partial [Armatimonadota bacterium]